VGSIAAGTVSATAKGTAQGEPQIATVANLPGTRLPGEPPAEFGDTGGPLGDNWTVAEQDYPSGAPAPPDWMLREIRGRGAPGEKGLATAHSMRLVRPGDAEFVVERLDHNLEAWTSRSLRWPVR
jgi:hypothetical protein